MGTMFPSVRMSSTSKPFKQQRFNLTSKPHTFIDKKFEIGGFGASRGFSVLGLNWKELKTFIEKGLPTSSFYTFTFSEKFIRMTGKPFESWIKANEKWLNLTGGVAAGGTETALKYCLGLPNLPVLTGPLTARKVRYSHTNVLMAVWKGKDQLKNPESSLSRWFDLTTETIIRPAILDTLVSVCLGDPSFLSAIAARYAFNKMFDFMRKATEDFFDPPLDDGDDVPPPPPPPPGDHSNHPKSGGDDDPPVPPQSGTQVYKQFPPYLVHIREGLRTLGMTWRGATVFLQGERVMGHDQEIVEWIASLVKIECLSCNLCRFVPESMLSAYIMHFPFNNTSVCWCPNCSRLTLVRISRVTAMRMPVIKTA